MRKFKLAPGVLSVGLRNGVLSDPNKICLEGMWEEKEAEKLVVDGHLVEVVDEPKKKLSRKEEEALAALADRAFAVGLAGDSSEEMIVAEEKRRDLIQKAIDLGLPEDSTEEEIEAAVLEKENASKNEKNKKK